MHNQPYVGRITLCTRKKLLKSGEIRDFYGTVLVTGLDYQKETETYQNLSENVAIELSKSGVKVSNSDFAACHRNGNKIKTVKRNGRK